MTRSFLRGISYRRAISNAPTLFVVRIASVLACVAPAAAYAQLGFPAVTQYGDGVRSDIPVWSAQAVVNISEEQQKGDESVSWTRLDYPKDSIANTVTALAQSWLPRVQDARRVGLHHDAYIRVLAAARKDALAQQQIAARLATPGLSIVDKAYVYQMAVEVFAQPGDADASTRLPLAERYLQDLIALGPAGPGGLARQFFAQLALVRAYYEANRPADVVRHGLAAVALVERVPFTHRASMYVSNAHELIVDALNRVPNGRDMMATMNETLRKGTVPPADSIAVDSSFLWGGQGYAQSLARSIKYNEMLGERRGPIVSNYWINTPDTTEHTVQVNDGKIRVIEVGSHTCGICLIGLAGLQRIHDAFPNIETVYLTWTAGFWGNRSLTPTEEAALLTDFYKNKKHVTLPIALWLQRRTLNEDGDMVPADDKIPAFERYPEFGKPQFYVLDGTGAVRRVFSTYSREIEQRIIESIRYLQKEASETPKKTARASDGTAMTVAAMGH